MPQGTVKWFNNAKGYGFVIDDQGGDDLFVHYSYINMEGFRTLRQGQRVSFNCQEAPLGRHAVDIVILDAPALINETDSAYPHFTSSDLLNPIAQTN